MALMPVEDALAKLLDGVAPLSAETVPLGEAAWRVLAGDLKALRTQPPFDASAMDGYAVRAADVQGAPVTLRVVGEAPAGRRHTGVVGPGEAVRIFTGAPMPDGADSVLIQENANPGDGVVEALQPVAAGRNVRRRGLDFAEGDAILEAGRVLDPAAIALAAAANHAALSVVRKPLVAILATGDELVPPGSEPGPDQIISSNSYGVAAAVMAAGGIPLDLGIAADRDEAIAAAVIRAQEAGADVLVTLGGASVGDHDLVGKVLASAGMKLDFWKIAMRPGKPLMAGSLDRLKVLGLPGNPVASLVCTRVFLLPLIARLAGSRRTADSVPATLGADLPANDLRQDYIRASVETRDGAIIATGFTVQDSSMLSLAAQADALIVREPHAPPSRAGDTCRILLLR